MFSNSPRALLAIAIILLPACSAESSQPLEPEPDFPETEVIDSIPVLEELPAVLADLRLDGSIGYEPAWPLWTNGLTKNRSILLPTGAKVDLSDREAWTFPKGTILLKTFSVRLPGGAEKPLETRALLKTDDAWVVGAYQWNGEGTSASLITALAAVVVAVDDADGNSFEHLIPSKADCAKCHGASPNFVLGFDELQLNLTTGGTDQLAELAQRGVFLQLPPAEPESIQADDRETEWVMGYLEGNCVHCHNQGASEADLSHRVFLADVVGGVGPSGTHLVVPGDPEASSIFYLLRDEVMPPVGVQLQDTASLTRLRAWIAGL